MWIGIVARRQIEVAFGIESNGASGVATLVALYGNFEQHFFGIQYQLFSPQFVAGEDVFGFGSRR